MKKPTPKLETEVRAFVRRYAAALGLDPDTIWRDHHLDLLKLGAEWFLNARKEQERLAADYQASRTPGRNSPSAIQWRGVETPPAPELTHRRSFVDYLERTTHAQLMASCRASPKRANRKRLLSSPPKHRLSRDDVWHVMKSARGRCTDC